MWKFGVVLIIVALGSSCAQNIILNCQFGDYGMGDLYMCSLQGITVLNPSVNVTFSGTHAENRTDADVGLVEIFSSNTPFIIRQLFTTFTNLLYLNIYDSNLETIVIPAEAQLLQLSLRNNNISKIESFSLRNQTQLRYFYIVDCGIKDVDEDAFKDLHSVEYFSLMGNEIQKLSTHTLAPLKNVVRINFGRNLLSTIGEEIFFQNTNMEQLYLENNKIEKIHPQAFANLRSNLTYLSLGGNQCVSQTFSLETDQDWNTMYTSLQPCIDNYGKIPEVRNITMQFSGPLALYDEFGNLIVYFNKN